MKCGKCWQLFSHVLEVWEVPIAFWYYIAAHKVVSKFANYVWNPGICGKQ